MLEEKDYKYKRFGSTLLETGPAVSETTHYSLPSEGVRFYTSLHAKLAETERLESFMALSIMYQATPYPPLPGKSRMVVDTFIIHSLDQVRALRDALSSTIQEAEEYLDRR